MIVHARSFVVSFLVLLQLVAPLIHAHKNDKFESSKTAIFHLHLPDLEQINTVLENGAMMTTISIHEGEVVTVSTGKQEERKRQLLDDLKTIVIISLLFTTLFKPVIHKIIVRRKPLHPSRFFNLASPRAPPLAIR
jgi:hypothetical protein